MYMWIWIVNILGGGIMRAFSLFLIYLYVFNICYFSKRKKCLCFNFKRHFWWWATGFERKKWFNSQMHIFMNEPDSSNDRSILCRQNISMYLKEYGSIHPTKHLTLLRCQNLSTPIFPEFKGGKEKKSLFIFQMSTGWYYHFYYGILRNKWKIVKY